MWDRFKNGKKDNKPVLLSVHNNEKNNNDILPPTIKEEDRTGQKMQPNKDIDIHQIISSLYEPVLEGLLKHPLFISAVIKQLEDNPQLIKTVVNTCFDSFESKYDITPTQVYKDKINESKTSLENLNRQIEQRSEVFEDFKTQIIDFQRNSSSAYLDSLNKLTEQLLQKYK